MIAQVKVWGPYHCPMLVGFTTTDYFGRVGMIPGPRIEISGDPDTDCVMDLDVPLVTLDGDGNVLPEERLSENDCSLNLESSEEAAEGSQGIDLVIGSIRIKTE